MNGYERMNQTLNWEKTDRVPVMIHNFLPCVREAGYTMEQFRNSPEIMAECFIRAAEKYGTDAILTDVDTALLASACGAKVIYPEDKPAVADHQEPVGMGELADRISAADILAHPRIERYLEAVGRIAKWCGREVFLRGNADQGPFALAFQLYGMERFLMDLMDEDNEGDIFRLLEACFDICLTFHKAVYAAGAHCTSYGDSASGPSVVSPHIYRKFAMGYQRRLAEELNRDGIKTICHMCGYVDRILDDFKETGTAGLEIDQKTNIEEAKRILNGTCVLSGNIDPSEIMCLGTPAQVEQEARKLLDLFAEKRGFMIGPGCALPADVPSENIFALVNTVKTYRA